MAPVDISIVIDSSASIGADNFVTELNFIRDFLDAFEISPSAIRVAAIMFGDRVYAEDVINFGDFTNKKDTLDAILNLNWRFGTSTNTSLGINYMMDNFFPHFRPDASHIAIVITDGQSQRKDLTLQAAELARDHDVTMLAVGVGELGSTISQDELVGIAGDESRVLTADDFNQLNTIRDSLVDMTCRGVSK